MQGPLPSDTNVMKQQGAGLEPSTFQPEVWRAIDCPAKACSCGRVDFHAYKPWGVTILRLPASVASRLNTKPNTYLPNYENRGRFSVTLPPFKINSSVSGLFLFYFGVTHDLRILTLITESKVFILAHGENAIAIVEYNWFYFMVQILFYP